MHGQPAESVWEELRFSRKVATQIQIGIHSSKEYRQFKAGLEPNI